MWNLRGNDVQNSRIRYALNVCDFPFDRMAPSLAKEGKSEINVDWEDLSRYTRQLEEQKAQGGHLHVHEGDATAHPVTRTVGGRERVLGLFYLPPYTRIVLDQGLVNNPELAAEVFLAEGAHAVDYHYMTNEMRVAFWNAIHADHEDLAEGTTVTESGDITNGHSWFDGPAGYGTWVGEAWMEGFVEAFSPVRVTINLQHPVPPEARDVIRSVLLGEEVVEPEPFPEEQVPPVDQPPSTGPVFAPSTTKKYHDSHAKIRQDRWFESSAEAQAAGLVACKVCKPR